MPDFAAHFRYVRSGRKEVVRWNRRPYRLGSVEDWQTLEEELILFPQAEHDDLFDALQTMAEGAMDDGGRFFCFSA